MTDGQSELLKRPFWHYIKKHKLIVLLGLGCLWMTNLLELSIPWLVGKTLDQITGEAPLRDVAPYIGRIFVVTLVLSGFRYMWRVSWASFHHTVAKDLRNRLFDQMSFLGPSFFQSRKIGQLISLISNDVNSFRMGIGPGLIVLFDGLSMVTMTILVMSSISWRWTLQTLILMPFVPIVVNRLLGTLHRSYHDRQERFGDLSGSAQEIVSGIRVIKSFAQEKTQTEQYNKHSQSYSSACDRVALWDAFFGPALELPVALGCVLLLLLGTPEVMTGQVSLGLFFAFYQYIQRLIGPVSGIGVGLGNVQEGLASFQRIKEVLVYKPDVEDRGELEIAELKTFEVRGLSFTYPGARIKALDNISFHLSHGDTLGIVGMTGSGKSTLVDLILRQYPVAPNTILINGISVEKIKLSSIRSLLSVVPQEAFLFSRKVSENLALGMDTWDLADVRDAAEHVRLDQEIDAWPGQFEALVGERGVNLSGGQKQRMTLARALARGTGLVILDDALSAVDAKTEENILTHLHDELTRTTAIVVSHRLASVRDADQILVLSGGRVENVGKHDELLRTSPTYQALCAMQMEKRLQ
jgi:ATP-binding cassette subfamily B multidrug efflux pump